MAADIEKALTYKVTQNAGVIAVISTRFYPIALPQTVTLPAATYQLISGVPIGKHDSKTVLPKSIVQITCWGTTFAEIVSVDKAIKDAIDGQKGNWGTSTYVTSVKHCIAKTTPRDTRDATTGLHIRSRDYSIMWAE